MENNDIKYKPECIDLIPEPGFKGTLINPIFFVDGAKGAGKTFLINDYIKKNNNHKLYKFPFVDYVEFQKNNGFTFDEINKAYSTHMFTLGYEYTVLSLLKDKIINNSLIIDRGPISNAVFAVLSKRTDKAFCETYLKNLGENGLLNNTVHIIVYGQSDKSKKDDWIYMNDINGTEKQNELYTYFADIIKQYCTVKKFNNEYNENSLKNFEKLFLYIK